MSLTANRRDFIKTSSALVIGFAVPTFKRIEALATEPPMIAVPNAFLQIGADNSVRVLLAHSEMGQGIWTGLAMLVAEELDADWSTIKVEHAPAAPAYFSSVFHMQGTGGSTTTWSEFDRYRQAGAAAREMLLQAASQYFKVPQHQLTTENGKVAAGDKSASYGQLVPIAAKLKAPDMTKVKLKDPKAWRILGKPTKRLDTPEKITGKALFGMDVQFEGLLTAVVAHAPVFGASVESFDATAAKAVTGVRHVVQIPSGIAVVADHYWAAKMGRDALKVEWHRGPNADTLDSAKLRTAWEALASTPGAAALNKGDAGTALGKAAKTVEMEFAFPYLAHAPMEPLNCTVRQNDKAIDIWVGTQFQTVDQGTAAMVFGVKPENVAIHTMFLGGGFGRRATPSPDMVFEACQVAKAVNAPVKTVWSREDDIKGGFYRSAFIHKSKVGIDANGMPMAWQHTAVGQSIMMGTPFEAFAVKNGIDHTSIEGVSDSPYLSGVADARVDLHSPKTGVSVLWWRSVGHSHTAYVMESLIDELAKAAGKDAVEYRRALLAKHPRHLGVLNLAAEKAGWGKPQPKGRALGIAVHESFGSYVCHCADVSVENGTIKVHNVTTAVDCGIVINPAGVRAQMESGIAYGLAAALHSRISFKNGEVEQSNFHDYQVLRIDEMPTVDVHIVPSTEKSGGVGEPGTAPIAPAVGNAIATITGQRLRELPFELAPVTT